MTLELNIFHEAKQPHADDDCAYVNLIGAVVQEEFNKNCLKGGYVERILERKPCIFISLMVA